MTVLTNLYVAMPRHGHSAFKVLSYWRKDVDRLLRRHRGAGVTVADLQAKRDTRAARREQAAKDAQARAKAKRAYMQRRWTCSSSHAFRHASLSPATGSYLVVHPYAKRRCTQQISAVLSSSGSPTS